MYQYPRAYFFGRHFKPIKFDDPRANPSTTPTLSNYVPWGDSSFCSCKSTRDNRPKSWSKAHTQDFLRMGRQQDDGIGFSVSPSVVVKIHSTTDEGHENDSRKRLDVIRDVITAFLLKNPVNTWTNKTPTISRYHNTMEESSRQSKILYVTCILHEAMWYQETPARVYGEWQVKHRYSRLVLWRQLTVLCATLGKHTRYCTYSMRSSDSTERRVSSAQEAKVK